MIRFSDLPELAVVAGLVMGGFWLLSKLWVGMLRLYDRVRGDRGDS